MRARRDHSFGKTIKTNFEVVSKQIARYHIDDNILSVNFTVPNSRSIETSNFGLSLTRVNSVSAFGSSCWCFSSFSLASSFRTSFRLFINLQVLLYTSTSFPEHGIAWNGFVWFSRSATGQLVNTEPFSAVSSWVGTTPGQVPFFRWSALIFRPSRGQELSANAYFEFIPRLSVSMPRFSWASQN